MILAPVLRQRFADANHKPLAGGKLFAYVAGTTTPQDTYSSSTGALNSNPVILDADGYCDLWLDPSLAYKFVLKDVNDVVIWTRDNVQHSTDFAVWNEDQSYDTGRIVQDASGEGMLYVSLVDDNVGNPLTDVSKWRVYDGKVRTITADANAAVTDNLIRSNSTSGNVTVTLPACASTPVGKRITVKDVGAGGFTTSVRGAGLDTVDGNVTFVPALSQYDSITVMNNGTSWGVVGDKVAAPRAPTATTFTSGSGTYNTPAGAKYLRVKMIGGGSGGCGGGTGGTAPTSGGNTTFGPLTANGGSGSVQNGSGNFGSGGTATIGSGAYGVALSGAKGGESTQSIANDCGVSGASSPLGGGGPSGRGGGTAGGNAPSNTGAGGGGGGVSAGGQAGAGGNAGGYIEAIIPSPAATYSYAVGAAGAGGTGASSSSGGNGGSGLIFIEEHYQ